jgi:hypothetical protein
MGVGDLVITLLAISFIFSGLVILIGHFGSRPRVKTDQEPAPGPSAALEEAEPQPEAVLKVGPERSVLVLPNRQVAIPYTDFRAIAASGNYLTPGMRLRVEGLVPDEAARIAAYSLEVMGAPVIFAEAEQA